MVANHLWALWVLALTPRGNPHTNQPYAGDTSGLSDSVHYSVAQASRLCEAKVSRLFCTQAGRLCHPSLVCWTEHPGLIIVARRLFM